VLFYRSGWTQEELRRRKVSSRNGLIAMFAFGRFLNFSPTGLNAETLPKTLTEGRFRHFWEQTDRDGCCARHHLVGDGVTNSVSRMVRAL
jgi:hypothetical protein